MIWLRRNILAIIAVTRRHRRGTSISEQISPFAAAQQAPVTKLIMVLVRNTRLLAFSWEMRARESDRRFLLTPHGTDVRLIEGDEEMSVDVAG